MRKGTGLQVDGEGGAATLLAIDADGATVLQDNLPAETEADAGASRLGGIEGDEGMLNDVGRHAAAVVADMDFIIVADANFYLRGAALVGILDEVDEHLLQLGAVGCQLPLTLGLYLWIESCDMSKEFADGDGRPFRCFDARQLAVALYEVE